MKILRYPAPKLREISRDVTDFDEAKRLVGDMISAMYWTSAAGLGAIQLGIPLRVLVIDGAVATGMKTSAPVVFINPEITDKSAEKESAREGCLSFPGIEVDVERYARVHVRATNLSSKSFEVTAVGLYARAIQHEMDHLNGRLIMDYAGLANRALIKSKMRKWKPTN